MNKLLLLLIVTSGLLLIFYTNIDLFRWKSNKLTERTGNYAENVQHLTDNNENAMVYNNNDSNGGDEDDDDDNDNDANNGDDNVAVVRLDDAKISSDDDNVPKHVNSENYYQRASEYRMHKNQLKHLPDNKFVQKNYRKKTRINNYDNDFVNDDPNSVHDFGNIQNSFDEWQVKFNSYDNSKRVKYIARPNETEYNIFVVYTKQNYLLKLKFELFIKSLLKYTSAKLHLHVISDDKSQPPAEEILKRLINQYERVVFYTMYNVDDCTKKISDISHIMMPYFSSHPGSYYSDALFYLSLGLHRIVDANMKRAILIDCDVVFRTDVKRLFDEFDKFSSDNLFGLAPELTPVYRHILYQYRAKNPNTDFGSPYYSLHSIDGKHHHGHHSNRKHGYPGLNSGVVLLDFNRIRKSKLYNEMLTAENVRRIAEKYEFKGHLGDQDYFTLLGYEFPSLIYRMDCVWNRQLCTWWKEHGYGDIFDTYFQCDGRIHLYHGNCNSRIPESR